MAASRTTIVISLAILALVASSTAVALEIYHWLDENGVPNFSQEKPDGKIPGVSKLSLVDTTPADYDPDEDRYGIEEQAERMKALREEMEQRRDATREHERIVAQQQVVQYREPYRSYSRGIWFPPTYPRPPLKPVPPIEVPYPTSTLRPPGQ
jgi:hypothetical protein